MNKIIYHVEKADHNLQSLFQRLAEVERVVDYVEINLEKLSRIAEDLERRNSQAVLKISLPLFKGFPLPSSP
jgi:hypothetical protein